MRYLFLILSLPCLLICVPQPPDRPSKAPYVSGDAFRNYADYAFDELDRSLDPNSVAPYSAIFVKTDYLREFFEQVHTYLQVPYVLISHNSDAPMPGEFSSYLEDEKLLAWFGQNWDGTPHPKIFPIPIGMANYCWGHGNSDLVESVAQMDLPKTRLLYMNINVQTFPSERFPLIRRFAASPYCYKSGNKPFLEYLKDVAVSEFEICPRGNGYDTHRLWEALYLGAIPIVKSSSLDPLYEGLPVLIISDWNAIHERFLLEAKKELQKKNLSKDKIWMDYWIALIESFKSGQLYNPQ